MKTYLGFVDGQEIPEDYDYYIWASERCLKGIRWCEENNRDYEIIPKNWATEDEIYGCMDYLETVREEVVRYAMDILNEYLAICYDRSQWSILLNQWLCRYLAPYYDKFMKIKWIINCNIKCECKVYKIDNAVPPLDYYDQDCMLYYSDSYHLYQYSQLLDQYDSGGRISIIERKDYERPKLERRKASVKATMFRKAMDILRIFNRKDAVILFDSYLPHRLLLRTLVKNFGRVCDYRYYYLYSFRNKLTLYVDESWREKATQISKSKDEFTGMMKSLLKINLPVSLVENFHLLRDKARKVYGKNSVPKAIVYSAQGTGLDELIKIYMADVKQKGTLLCGIQHGGNYGIENTSWEIRTEIDMSDRFYTWGWTDKNSPCELKPMPVTKVLERTFTSLESDMDVLYVSYRLPKNISKIRREDFLFDEYIQGEVEFISSLDKECLRQLRFRAFEQDSGWGEYDAYSRIKKKMPDLREDRILNFYESLNNAKLVVLGMWSTTAIEALCAGRPILVRNDMQGIRPEAKADLAELERMGILCRTFEELAERLNQIYANAEEWWNEPDRKKAVERIKERYAWMPSDAEERWLEEIKSLSAGV